MSTNYYFKVETSCKFCENIEIHIGKRSMGWEPCFQNTKYYETVEEIRKFYNENKEVIIIENEYQEILTFDELEKELINWNKNSNDILLHEIRYGDYRDYEGYFFIESEFS